MLSYTEIVAPIAGRTGLRLVDEGNIVQASDANRHRRDHAGQADLGAVQPAAAAVPDRSTRAFAEGPLPVDAIGPDGKTHDVDKGNWCWWSTTRSIRPPAPIRMKAEFPNAELQLWPGQFVNMRRAGRHAARRSWWCRPLPCSAARTAPFVYVVEAETRPSRCGRSRLDAAGRRAGRDRAPA